MEQRAPQGFSPPLHVHHGEDTALLVLDGAITAVVGTDRVELAAGGFVWLPRDVPHTFRVDSAEARLLELVTPAGFEAFHVETSELAGSLDIPPPSEPDIPRLARAAALHDAELLGPPLGPND